MEINRGGQRASQGWATRSHINTDLNLICLQKEFSFLVKQKD